MVLLYLLLKVCCNLYLSIFIQLHDNPGWLLLSDPNELHNVGVVHLLHQCCGCVGKMPLILKHSHFTEERAYT